MLFTRQCDYKNGTKEEMTVSITTLFSQDDAIKPNDARKQLLLDLVAGQSRRITRQNMSNINKKLV